MGKGKDRFISILNIQKNRTFDDKKVMKLTLNIRGLYVNISSMKRRSGNYMDKMFGMILSTWKISVWIMFSVPLLKWLRSFRHIPYSKIHWAHMGPTWVLSAPGRPHVGPMNLAIRDGTVPFGSFNISSFHKRWRQQFQCRRIRYTILHGMGESVKGIRNYALQQ